MNQEIEHRLIGDQREGMRVQPLLLTNKLCYKTALGILERTEVLIRFDERLDRRSPSTFKTDEKCRSLLQKVQKVRLESTEWASCARSSIVQLVKIWNERNSLNRIVFAYKAPMLCKAATTASWPIICEGNFRALTRLL
jgi:hypothetical protein